MFRQRAGVVRPEADNHSGDSHFTIRFGPRLLDFAIMTGAALGGVGLEMANHEKENMRCALQEVSYLSERCGCLRTAKHKMLRRGARINRPSTHVVGIPVGGNCIQQNSESRLPVRQRPTKLEELLERLT